MRGGKREGAGRKSYGKTKTYRLPIALEPEIKAILEKYKTEYEKKQKIELENVTNSIKVIKPENKTPTKEQIKFFTHWLTENKFTKSLNEARKITRTHKLFKKAFLKYSEEAYDMRFNIPKEFEAIFDLYYIEE